MSRKTLIIIFSLALVLIIGAGVIRWYFSSPTIQTIEIKNSNPYQGVINQFVNLTQKGTTKIEEVVGISSDNLSELNNYQLVVADYTLFTNSTSTYWLAAEKKTGYFYLGDTSTKTKTKISNLPFLNIDHLRVLVKKDGLVIVIHNQNPNDRPSVKLIDLDIKTGSSSVKELPKNIQGFVVSPDQKQIILTQDVGEKENWLLTDANFDQFKTIYSTSYQAFTLNWSAPDLITFYTKPSDLTTGVAYSFNLKTKLVEKIGEGTALELATNPNLKQIIVSKNEGGQIIANLKTVGNAFSFPTTASKCLAPGDFNTLCAIPNYYLTSVDDWYKGKIASSDNLYLIDNQTGKGSKWRTLNNLDVINLQTTPDRKLVFFMDKTSGNLWSALAE